MRSDDKVVRKPLNEGGRPIGEGHHKFLLKDAEVDAIRELHEECGFSYDKIAWMFGVGKLYIRDLCKYRRRAQTLDRYSDDK